MFLVKYPITYALNSLAEWELVLLVRFDNLSNTSRIGIDTDHFHSLSHSSIQSIMDHFFWMIKSKFVWEHTCL